MTRKHGVLALLWTVLSCAVLAAPAEHDEATLDTVIEDPHYGDVLFHFYQEDYFTAIVRLMAAQASARLPGHDAEAELLLGGLSLSYGQHQKAADIFARLLQDSNDAGIRDRTWFFLARIWQQRGYPDKALDALSSIEQALPEPLQAERQMLLAQLLIESGNYRDAIRLLDEFRDRTEWADYARFNLGVALARDGQSAEATRVLDDLGGQAAASDERAALKDKANLALGYTLLQQGAAENAKAALRRVRLNGPFSNKALLGVGWADAEQARFEQALLPWMELRDRSLADPAVQESMLAVPYAMARLDAPGQAASHYQQAIDAFERENRHIEQVIVALESGDLFARLLADQSLQAAGWYWRLQDLPDGTEARYLFKLIADHQFQEGLKNLRDLDFLARNLQQWRSRVDVFHSMLGTRQQAYRARLPEVLLNLEQMERQGFAIRMQQLAAELERIENERDVVALADAEELAMWDEIMALEEVPAIQADIPDAADARRKLHLMRGVLQWQLEKSFKERLWRISRDLQEGNQALAVAQRSRLSLDTSMREEPQRFEDFDERIIALQPQIELLQKRVAVAYSSQRNILLSMALDEMSAQQERLRTYAVQARFALAAIYDLSATTTGQVQ